MVGEDLRGPGGEINGEPQQTIPIMQWFGPFEHLLLRSLAASGGKDVGYLGYSELGTQCPYIFTCAEAQAQQLVHQ